ncbi:unnamed protein product [Adineta ricciae]|uniref:Uncharacterized protein n=1 Tax=Adineta ricciae TaxID=249248 RepID=A0A815C073_ADIRI|nr:unnamed protein product [Adineta ricciae]
MQLLWLYSQSVMETRFFTYICVSKRFRRQAKYVFYETYTNRCGKNRVNPNEMKIQVFHMLYQDYRKTQYVSCIFGHQIDCLNKINDNEHMSKIISLNFTSNAS